MKPQLTLEAFADWCEKQPADQRYRYLSLRNCACAQFAQHNKVGDWMDTSEFWMSADDYAVKEPHTFGALALRLRAAV